MKKFNMFLGFCLVAVSLHTSVAAQKIYTGDSSLLKERIYKVSVITADSKKSRGYLANFSDSNLFLFPSALPFSPAKVNEQLPYYAYPQIEKIEIKRKGAAGRAAWKGAVIGLAAGVIAGFISGDDPVAPTYNNPNDPFGTFLGNTFSSYNNALRMTAGEKALALGIAGAATGALAGVLIGSLVKKTFVIGRNKQKFRAMRENILEKLYVH